MKKDKFESFIASHRDEFDSESPSASLWDKIDAQIPVTVSKKSRISFVMIRNIAAAFILVFATFSISYYLFNNSINPQAQKYTAQNRQECKRPKIIHVNNTIIVNNQKNESESLAIASNKSTNVIQRSIKSEFEELSGYYVGIINIRKNEIIQLTSGHSQVAEQVVIEVSQLDSIAKSLKNDLKDNMNNREVIESMILHYRLKLELLDNILLQLKGEDHQPVKNVKYEI